MLTPRPAANGVCAMELVGGFFERRCPVTGIHVGGSSISMVVIMNGIDFQK